MRRKARLARFAVSVVTELDSLIGEVAGHVAPAAEAAPGSSSVGAGLDGAHRAARRALEISRHFLGFSHSLACPLEPTDLGTLIRGLEATLKQLVGSNHELLLRIETTPAPVSLSREHIGRLLFSVAALCRDALPIGGEVIFETKNIEMAPPWDPLVSHADPLPFVCVTASVSGHAPRPMHPTPSLESLIQECDGHLDEVSVEEPLTGLRMYLPRSAGRI